MAELNRADIMAAVSNGVRDGMLALGTTFGKFDLPHELLYQAIRQGVTDAVLQLAANATRST